MQAELFFYQWINFIDTFQRKIFVNVRPSVIRISLNHHNHGYNSKQFYETQSCVLWRVSRCFTEKHWSHFTYLFTKKFRRSKFVQTWTLYLYFKTKIILKVKKFHDVYRRRFSFNRFFLAFDQIIWIFLLFKTCLKKSSNLTTI